MGAVPKIRMTVPEFVDWWDRQPADERYELVDGEVVAMGRDRVEHNRAKLRAANALNEAIRRAGVPCEAFIDGIGVAPDNANYRLPDAVVNCGPVPADSSILPNPVVMVEIVSPSSERRDAHEKLKDYFSIPSVSHYLIVYGSRGYVVHHRRAGAGEPVETRFVSDEAIELSPPGLSVDVAALLGERDR